MKIFIWATSEYTISYFLTIIIYYLNFDSVGRNCQCFLWTEFSRWWEIYKEDLNAFTNPILLQLGGNWQFICRVGEYINVVSIRIIICKVSSYRYYHSKQTIAIVRYPCHLMVFLQ